jgi:hypothetical protein
MSMNTMLLGTVAISGGEWIGQWDDGAGWFGEGLSTACYKKCNSGNEHCLYLTLQCDAQNAECHTNISAVMQSCFAGGI